MPFYFKVYSDDLFGGLAPVLRTLKLMTLHQPHLRISKLQEEGDNVKYLYFGT